MKLLDGEVRVTKCQYLRGLAGGIYLGGVLACSPKARALVFLNWGGLWLWERRFWLCPGPRSREDS